MSADPMVDLARQHLTLTFLPIEDPRPVARQFERIRRYIHGAFVETYAGLAATSITELVASFVPFVPAMAALRLAEPACSAVENEMLTELIRSHAAAS